MDREFIPPAPGVWVLETAHAGGAAPAFSGESMCKGLARGFKEGNERYGMMMSHLQPALVNNFMYIKQVMVGAPEDNSKLPPAWLLMLMTRLHPELRKRYKTSKIAFAECRWRKDLEEWDNEFKPDSIKRNQALQSVAMGELDDKSFLRHLVACEENMEEMYYRHHKYSTPSILPTGYFVSFCTMDGEITAEEAVSLLTGSTPISKGAAGEELLAVVAALKDAGVSTEDLEATDAKEIVSFIESQGTAAQGALKAYLDIVGHMVVSGYSTIEKIVLETPHILKAKFLAAMKDEPLAQDEGEFQKQVETIRSKLPTGKHDEFDHWLTEARHINRLRDERGIFNDMWGVGIARMAVLEAGRRLLEKGRLQDQDLVLEATRAEIESLFDAEDAALIEEFESRRDWRNNTRIEDVPQTLGGDPPPPPPLELLPKAARPGVMAILGALNHVFDDGEVEETEVIQGKPVSPGTYEGIARVIKGPEDFGRLEQGDVLITKNTSAAFNVILPILGALVTDRGGILSHAAIISREYGIPGIVSTRTATARIPDGARVRVNGDSGIVEVL